MNSFILHQYDYDPELFDLNLCDLDEDDDLQGRAWPVTPIEPGVTEAWSEEQPLRLQMPSRQLFLAEFADPETAELAGELFIEAASARDAMAVAQDHADRWGIAIFSISQASEKQVRLHRLKMAS